MRFQVCARCGEVVPSGPPACLKCGLEFYPQPTDRFLRDVVSAYALGHTRVWIFPTCIFGAMGIAYWTQPASISVQLPFA